MHSWLCFDNDMASDWILSYHFHVFVQQHHMRRDCQPGSLLIDLMTCVSDGCASVWRKVMDRRLASEQVILIGSRMNHIHIQSKGTCLDFIWPNFEKNVFLTPHHSFFFSAAALFRRGHFLVSTQTSLAI